MLPPTPCYEIVTASIQIKSREPINEEFLIVPGNLTPLLGRETAEKQGVLSIDVNHISSNPRTSDTA